MTVRSWRELPAYLLRREGETTVRQLMQGVRRYRNNKSNALTDLQVLELAGLGTWKRIGKAMTFALNAKGYRSGIATVLHKSLRGN